MYWKPRLVRAAALLGLLLASCGPISFRDDIGGTVDPLVLQPASVSIQVNGTVVLTASGGVPPYDFTDGDGAALAQNEDQASVTYQAPAVEGTYVVSVVDAQELISQATVMVTAAAPLSVSPKAATISVDTALTLVATGGTPPYLFAKETAGDLGTLTPDSRDPNGAVAIYRAAGPGAFTIKVTDSSISAVTAEITVVVSDGVPGALAIVPLSVSLQVNQGITFSAANGTPPYRYSLASGDGVIDPSSGTYTAPAAAGAAVVRVTDAAGATDDAALDIYFPLTIVPVGASVQQGGTYTFSAEGGLAPYVYEMVGGGGTIDPSSGLYTAPGAPGSATVRVHDALGNASYADVDVLPPPPTWSLESVDTAAKSGQYASLALDPVSGNPWVAYYDAQGKRLKVAWRDGATWHVEVADESGSDVGRHCSIALDASGSPRIAYCYSDGHDRSLRCVARDGSTWGTPQVVASGNNVGQYASLALDPSTGYPRISYYDGTAKDLEYAEWSGDAWSITAVDQGGDVGRHTSLALDGSGNPRIAYYDFTSRSLKYAARDGAGWGTPQVVDGTADRGAWASLALDGAGNPHISYYDATATVMRHAWFDGAWHTEQVDPVTSRGMYSSIAIDPVTGFPRISYYNADPAALSLMLASYNGSAWAIETVDAGPSVGTYTSLAVDAAGHARIAYYDPQAQDLRYASQH